ncbi:hypothetical protein GGX14DRAFT_632485, partial [Mycena pura]
LAVQTVQLTSSRRQTLYYRVVALANTFTCTQQSPEQTSFPVAQKNSASAMLAASTHARLRCTIVAWSEIQDARRLRHGRLRASDAQRAEDHWHSAKPGCTHGPGHPAPAAIRELIIRNTSQINGIALELGDPLIPLGARAPGAPQRVPSTPVRILHDPGGRGRDSEGEITRDAVHGGMGRGSPAHEVRLWLLIGLCRAPGDGPQGPGEAQEDRIRCREPGMDGANRAAYPQEGPGGRAARRPTSFACARKNWRTLTVVSSATKCMNAPSPIAARVGRQKRQKSTPGVNELAEHEPHDLAEIASGNKFLKTGSGGKSAYGEAKTHFEI